MGHPWIIILVVSLQGVRVNAEDRTKISDTLWLYDIKLTWDEAFETCRDIYATLAVPTPEEVEKLRQLLTTSDPFWVGQYTYTTPWMYPTGCFSSTRQIHRIEQNDISECRRFCGASDILVNIYNCVCVDEPPDVSTRKPLKLCNITCPGQKEDYCGGHEVYQHYVTYTDIKGGISRSHCGMAEKGSSIVIKARRCLIPKAFLCAVDSNDSSDRPFYIPQNNNGSALFLNYKNALKHCVTNGSYLANPTKLSVSQFRYSEPSQYWVGVRRRELFVESVKDPPSNVTNQWCLYIVKGSPSVSQDRLHDCTKKSSFLCRQKQQNYSVTAVTEISDATTTTDITRAVTRIPDATTSTDLTREVMITGIQDATTSTDITRPEVTTITSDVSTCTKAAIPSSTTDINDKEPPVTQSDIRPYTIVGCATISVLTALGIIVCVRRRRHRTKEAADRDYDYLDITVGEMEHESRRLAEGDTERSHTASKGETTGQKGNTVVNLLKYESNPHCLDLSGSIRDDAPYDLAQNCDNLYDLANNSPNEQSPKHEGSLLEHEANQNVIRHVASDSDLYNDLHKDPPRHNARDDVYDHIGAVSGSDEELYHKIQKPGYRNREVEISVYDMTQNTLDSGVYNTLTNAPPSANGNDTYNPYVDDRHSDPLP